MRLLGESNIEYLSGSSFCASAAMRSTAGRAAIAT